MKPPYYLILALATLFICSPAKAQMMGKIDKSTVEEFNLNQYLGTWYEIARFPHSFEKGLQGVSATYSIRKDGKIKVLNQGYRGSLEGKHQKAIGKAKPNKNGKPGQLKVSFFWFFYGDYYIMELDKDYQWALIGSKSDKFLWILSRTPQMKAEVYDFLIQRAKERGYDLSDLELVQQTKT